MTLNIAQFCDDSKKHPQNLHTQENIHFSENPKKYRNSKILKRPKMYA